MNIFIISLDRAVHRREKVTSEMGKLNLDFQFFNAIDGSKPNSLIKKHYCDKKRINRKGYSLNPGELGCFASHYLLWQKCVEINEPIVVLEDDITPDADLGEIVNELALIIPSFGLIRLGKILDATFFTINTLTDKRDIVKYTSRPSGAAGYIISPSTAKLLISNSQLWFEPVDDFMDKEWYHKVCVYAVEPPCIIQNDEGVSYIGDRTKIRVSLLQRLKRETYRTYEKFRHAFYLTQQLTRIKKEIAIREKNH